MFIAVVVLKNTEFYIVKHVIFQESKNRNVKKTDSLMLVLTILKIVRETWIYTWKQLFYQYF